MDLHLNDSGDPVLDRVFDRDHVDAAVLEQSERGVERRRLCLTGRASHENQTFADLEQLLHARAIDRVESQASTERSAARESRIRITTFSPWDAGAWRRAGLRARR